MAKKKYYAVKKGKTSGIYETWDECSRNVTGVPGAQFKGFATIEEAREYLGAPLPEKSGNDSVMVSDGVGETKISAKFSPGLLEDRKSELIAYMKRLIGSSDAIAFVDGSYDSSTGDFAYGMLIYHDGVYEEFSEKFTNDARNGMHNVAGEIEGSMHAMKYALQHGLGSISIHYDYEGIEKWCTGVWKATKEGTISYRDYYLSVKDRVKVNFVKVKGHSGDPGNERADELARMALGK
ncbi:MAG: ribonuclease H family protein [Eubacterium sp.]|nr:ribonuclease H family protein [Eubacterium sp.]